MGKHKPIANDQGRTSVKIQNFNSYTDKKVTAKEKRKIKIEKIKPERLNQDWLISIQQNSKLLIAVLEPETFTILHANESLCHLAGINFTENNLQEKNICLFDLLNDFKPTFPEQLYRRHLLPLVLRDVYGIEHSQWRFLDEPAIASFTIVDSKEIHYLQFWLRSQHLKVERIDPNIDEFANLHLSKIPLEELILQPSWEEKLQLKNYRVKGQFLWEGLDVTNQEIIQRLINLLIERESIFRPKKFIRLCKQMQLLFRANNGLFLSVKREQVQLFTLKERKLEQINFSSLDSLKGSHFLQAAETNSICNISNLIEDCHTEFEQKLVNQGVRSLLLIPLVITTPKREGTVGQAKQLMGLVGMTSDRSNNFDQLDINHANILIPALKAALHQAIQVKFSHIHPSVEWRFMEEAERRSWGFPSTPIVFTNVYPMYGISDIRGSSQERNRAVQEDLLTQFRLGLAVVEEVCQHQDIPFLQQLKLDLLAYIERLSQSILVEDEVTAIQYLSKNVEAYFDYFQQYNTKVQTVVETYQQACANEHHCVYIARDRYDKMIQDINRKLRETWEKRQVKMQQIIPHYCDIESTDGIDHMIYVGSSINQQFSRFHLHALRYEQLRALCDCARTCFQLRDQYDTPLQVTHLVLVQDIYIDIFHDEQTEKLFDVRGTRDTRYEIVKKRIDKAMDAQTHTRITQPGMLTVVYSTEDEWTEYRQYLRYLVREGWVDSKIETGLVEPLQGVTGLKFARVSILSTPENID